MFSRQEILFSLLSLGLAAVVLLVWSFIQGELPDSSRLLDWKTIFWACVFYPICEELIFRGLLQQELYRIPVMQRRLGQSFIQRMDFPGISIGNVAVSMLFGLVHVWRFSNPAAGWVFFPSLLLGAAFDIRRRLWMPIILHGLFNLLGLFFMPFYSNLASW